MIPERENLNNICSRGLQLILPRLLSWSMAAWPTESSSFSTRRTPAVIRPIESISDLHRKARCLSSSRETTASIWKKELLSRKAWKTERDVVQYIYRFLDWKLQIFNHPLGHFTIYIILGDYHANFKIYPLVHLEIFFNPIWIYTSYKDFPLVLGLQDLQAFNIYLQGQSESLAT